jgi:hypothetical protein
VQIQVILSLVVIFAAAAAALLVDYFRNKNQQLREATVEMKVRQIEKERQMLAEGPAYAGSVTVSAQGKVPAPSAAEFVLSADAAGPAVVFPDQEQARNLEVASSADPARLEPKFTSRRRRWRAAGASTDPDKKDEDMDSKKVFSDWLVQRAAARAAQKMAADASSRDRNAEPILPISVDRETQDLPAPEIPAVVEPPAATFELTESEPERVVIEPPAIHGFESKFEPVVIDEFLWQSLFENKADPKPAPIVIAATAPAEPPPVVKDQSPSIRQNQGFQIVQPITPPAESVNVPSGFHAANALDGLKDSDGPFSGLVVSIGITHGESQNNEELARTVTGYIRTLLRESDFGCRTADDEYLLICPNLSGVAAHRHLSILSERLWDFQLRALGSFLMLFSLGGVDVLREPLGEAIASATERMSQTKRSRKAVVMLTPGQRRRKAV